MRDRPRPPHDEAAFGTWLDDVAVENAAHRLDGDLVVVDPSFWADLKIVAVIFGWRPIVYRTVFANRELGVTTQSTQQHSAARCE